eukprot:gene18968-29213_t
MADAAIAETTSERHALQVLYITTAEQMEEAIKKHILDENISVVGLAYKSKIYNKIERKRRAALVQLSTDKVSLVIHLMLMGVEEGDKPKSSPSFNEVMQDPEIKKVGLNVLQLVSLLKNDYSLDCKGVYDLVPMAQRVKHSAAFKGMTQYQFPDLEVSEQINKGIWALSDMALGTVGFKTPPDAHCANWEKALTPSVLDWASFEPVVGKKVQEFLNRVEEEIEQAKGPTALHITNLPGDVSKEDLVEHFECTASQRPNIHTAPKNRSTANAAVFYSEEEEALAALDKFNHSEFRGREVLIAKSEDELKTVEQDMQKARLDYQIYISNLPYFTTEAQLRAHFKGLQEEIREAKFYCHQDLGVGSVYFKTKEAASRAIREYQNSRFLYAVHKMDPVTKKMSQQRRFRVVILDYDFQTVIKKQKREDRTRGKSDEHYDALDPYYSHQQRQKGWRKDARFDDMEPNPFGTGPLEGETIEDAPRQKPKMRRNSVDKPRMRAVREDDTPEET